MPSSVNDLLAFAKDLEEKCSGTEEGLRAVASRRYYASFHRARAAAMRLPAPPEDAKGSHDQVIRQFRDIPPKWHNRNKIKEIGDLLWTVRDIRHKADYDLDTTFSAEHLEELKYYCEELEQLLDELEID